MIKTISLSAVAGLILGCLVIYWLELESMGAVSLVLLITVSLATSVGGLLGKKGK